MHDLSSIRIVIRSNVIFQRVHDEAVLLDLDSEQYYALNEVGMLTWQLLSEGKEFSTIIPQLLNQYDVDEASLCKDLSDWIDELAELGLVGVAYDAR